MSNTPTPPHARLALWLGIAGAAALGLGYPSPIAESLSLIFGVASGTFVINKVLFFASIALVVAALFLRAAPTRSRVIGTALTAGGYLVAVALYFLAGGNGWHTSLVLAAVLVIGLVVSGLLVDLGSPGRSFAWLALILLPAGVGGLAESLAELLVTEVLAAAVAGLIVGLGGLSAHNEPARRAEREARTAARAAANEQEQLAQRVAEIQQWEEAYALAHNGERPPAGYMPPIPTASTNSSTRGTNTLAILALVFSIIASVVGLILGYVARSQIRRSGENGAGLALAAIIIGWIEVGLIAAGLIFYVVVLAAALA
ncbi:MAG: DUF4190 domain-containing protein [Propionibacteriaceae bacterium]|jgi:hypothetical protein|nr:DUF4190 domain-containing protein [Propionibacteriaceae bacterium]